jgi:hypothetical protein
MSLRGGYRKMIVVLRRENDRGYGRPSSDSQDIGTLEKDLGKMRCTQLKKGFWDMVMDLS